MPRRISLAVVALAVATSLMPSAHAEEEIEGTGFNIGNAGVVVGADTYEYAEMAGRFDIGGDCDYEGVIVPFGQDGGGHIVRFRGHVSAAGPAIPIVANVRCEIRTASGYNHSQDFQVNGNSVVVEGSTLNDESQIWPLEPVTVCVSGMVVFGPSPSIEVRFRKRCKTP